MAGSIQFSELFNNDVQAKLAELQGLVNVLDQDFQGLSKTITGMSGRINVSIKTNTQTLKDLETSVGQVNVAAKGASDTLVKHGRALDETSKQTGNLKTQSENLRKIFDLSTASVDQIKDRVKKLTADYNSMGGATDKNNTKLQTLAKRIVELKGVQDGLSASLRKSKTAMQDAEGSYNQMSQRLLALRKALDALPNAVDKNTGALNKSNKAAVGMKTEIDQLDRAVKKYDANLGRHQRNVGNYSSALGGVKGQLTSLVAGYISIQAAMQLAGRAFDSALQTDAIRTVLTFTFKSADIADQKLKMLRATADRLGVGYIALANTYKSFTAAAIASNFPIAEAEKIFNSVSNAGAKLKLTSDQMSGALLALQQMISKGNVQAEELRGQLGERLPGAFAIAARAMGVTESELGKMLKSGEVLASELLPKLAIELDKTFGNDQTERIESLQSSWERLKNTFDLTVESGGVSKFFKFWIDGTNDILSSLKRLTGSQSWIEFMVRGTAAFFGAGELLDNYTKRNNLKSGATQAFPGSQGDVNSGGLFAQPKPNSSPVADAIVGDKGKLKEAKNELQLLQERISKITEALKLQALAAITANKAFKPDPETIALLTKLQEQFGFADRGGRNEQITQKAKTGNKVSVSGGGLSFVDDLEKLQSLDRARIEAPLLAISDLLDKIAEADKKGQLDLTEIYSQELQKRLQKTEEAKLAFMDAMSTMRQSAEVLGEIFGLEFGNMFTEITNTLEDFVVNGKVGFEQLAQVAISSVRSINESYQQGTALRIEQLQLEKQAQIDIAGTNKDARLNIEKEYNERIRAEKIKQARLDKTAAVFEIGINTAIAVSKTLAETAIFGIPLIPVIIALGLAQIATVLAKPIPGFKHGTQNAPEGLAEVAEEGAEAIQSPSGHLRIAHKKQLTYLQKGSKVFTASETKRMMDIHDIERTTDTHSRLAISLHDRKRDDQIQTMAAAFYASRTNEELIGQSVGKEIAKLPFGSVTFDENGVTHFIQTRTTKTKMLNKRYSLK